MAGQVSVISAKTRFESIVVSRTKLFCVANDLKSRFEVHQEQGRLIVELAFLSIVASWEEFMIDSMRRYLCGGASANGYKPALRFRDPDLAVEPFKKLDDAFIAMYIQQTPQRRPTDLPNASDIYIKTDINNIKKLAKYFFEKGGPYRQLYGDKTKTQKLFDASVMRNRIAHNSSYCISEFKRFAKSHLGRTYSGLSVGDVLLSEPQPTFPRTSEKTLFSAYTEFYRSLAETLVPG